VEKTWRSFPPYRYCVLLIIDAQPSPPMIFTFGSFDFCQQR